MNRERIFAKYVLNAEGRPIIEPDLLAWGEWMESGNRRVDKTMVGDVMVSTVFLGIDHNFSGKGEPILFETMIFWPENHDETFLRTSTMDEAKAAHSDALSYVKKVASE